MSTAALCELACRSQHRAAVSSSLTRDGVNLWPSKQECQRTDAELYADARTVTWAYQEVTR